MASSLAAFPNVMSFNCSTQGSGRPAGRRHPRAIAGSVSLWCGDNPTLVVHALAVSQFVPTGWLVLEVWPESHWPGFALRQAGVFQSYTAFNTCRVPTVTSTIDVKKTTAWGESGFPARLRGANQFLNLARRPHTPQADGTPRSTADSARGANTRPTMALIPAGAPHADINGRSPGTERLQSQWLGGRRKSRLAWAWTTRVEATIPKVESSAQY